MNGPPLYLSGGDAEGERESINHSITEAINQSINQSIDRSIDRSIDQSNKQTIACTHYILVLTWSRSSQQTLLHN